ncbi:hypothetical protein PVK06_008118 [Gossypium arboreum]|uniref:Uncharacterized protein n=1 Tax=Gossypium arboreum TaxID=29729 RepID=A0ABR0QJ41_GOSAR|nr:hypothetical protein PVK06_008118 [Gossypium arboreum]
MKEPQLEDTKASRSLPKLGSKQSDRRGRTDEHWPTFHAKYINLWNNRYEVLPSREIIVALELTYNPKYMSWLRVHGKPYLLAKEVKGRQPHTRRPQRVPRHLRFRADTEGSPSSTPTQEPTSMSHPS